MDIIQINSKNLTIATDHQMFNRVQIWLNFYGIKFINDLQQVKSFLRVLWFPTPIKLKLLSQKPLHLHMDDNEDP